MTQLEWKCPEANDDGFIPMRRLARAADRKSREQFLRTYPLPALKVLDHEGLPSSSPEPFGGAERGVQLLTATIESVAILRYLTKVAFIAKKPGNLYQHLIYIGRSPKNDITINVESVSKVHGYFALTDDGWTFTDHGSTNGSFLNETELEKGRKFPLRDGDRLRLGLDVVLEFLSPEVLYHHASNGVSVH